MAVSSKRKSPVQFFCLWVCLAALPASAQTLSSQAEMHARVVSLYSFAPHTLTDAARKEKSTQMDSFWTEVKMHPDVDLPLLRVELDNGSNPAFFFADGTGLLLSLSREPSDEALAAVAMARADIVDVQPSVYFYTIHQLSMDGVDTTAAALHVLDDPTFAVPVPAHAMTLRQQSVLLYLLLPVDELKWINAARSRFAMEKNETALKSLLALFFYAQSDDTDQMIKAAAAPTSFSEAVGAQAMQYQRDAKQALKTRTGIQGSEETVREDRRKRLAAVSDESIDDVQQMTVRLIQIRHEQTHSK